MRNPDNGTRWEELKVNGDRLVATVKDLIREGNVRRIVIKNEAGRVYIEIPLTVGVVGALFLPVFAALSALAAVASGLTIAVEKIVPPGEAAAARVAPPPASEPTTGAPTEAELSDPAGDDGPEG